MAQRPGRRVRGKGQKRYLRKGRVGDNTSRDKVILDIRKDDNVMIMRGDDSEKTGKVLRVIPHKRQVVVQNVNYVWRHLRRSQQNPQGGRVHKEAPLPIAAVAVVCSACSKPTRVYRKPDEKGNRYCKRCDKPVVAK
jgi:large subunit ribosomal protein L24